MMDGPVPRSGILRDPASAPSRPGDRREGAESATRSIGLLYQFSFAASFNTTVPSPGGLGWMGRRATRTTSTPAGYRPLWDRAKSMADGGNRFFVPEAADALPDLSDPDGVPPSPTTRRRADACAPASTRGERFNFCSDGCKWIFDREPEKYVQAWLPVHQIYQGNCGGGPPCPTCSPGNGIQGMVSTTAEYLDLARQGVLGCLARADSRRWRWGMTVKALYDYDYPSKDRQELFGDDILVNVMWTTTGCWPLRRASGHPRRCPGREPKSQMIDTWAASDPDYDPFSPDGLANRPGGVPTRRERSTIPAWCTRA